MTITLSTTDKGEARDLLKAKDVKLALREFYELLFNAVDEDGKPWGEVFNMLTEIMEKYDVNLEDDYEPTEDAGCACGRAADAGGDGADGNDGAAPVAGRRG